MKKNLLAMLLMVVMSLSLLAGCGGDEEVLTGTYTNEGIKVEFSEDGTYVWEEDGETRKGTYELSKDDNAYWYFYFDNSKTPDYLVSMYELNEGEIELWLSNPDMEGTIQLYNYDVENSVTDTEE